MHCFDTMFEPRNSMVSRRRLVRVFFISATPKSLDLGFLFGADGPSAQTMFAAEKRIAKKTVSREKISELATLVGAVIYDNGAYLGLKLGEATDLSTTLANIDRLQRRSAGNNVAMGLKVAYEELFFMKNGARYSVPKTLVVFIDKAKMRDQELERAASKLRDAGVKIIVVAVGSEVNKDALYGLTSDPAYLLTPNDLVKGVENISSTVAALTKPGKSYSTVLITI